MADHGIAFSPAMVSAIFAGRKYKTRRLLKVQPPAGATVFRTGRGKFVWDWPGLGVGSDDAVLFLAPPYAKDDRLWVRETHFKFGFWEPDPAKTHHATAKRPPLRFVPMSEASFDPPRYPITARQGPPPSADDWARPTIYKRPARFMFRADARLNLIVEDVDFERLDEVTSIEAEAEGIAAASKDGRFRKFGIPDRDGLPGTDNEGWAWADWQQTPRDAFVRLWNSIHGDNAFAANPWVTVTTFRIETPN